MTRKPKPWAVILSTPGGPVRSDHTSETKAYEKANAERDAIFAGTSRAYKVRVDWWDHTRDRWVHYEDVHPAV